MKKTHSLILLPHSYTPTHMNTQSNTPHFYTPTHMNTQSNTPHSYSPTHMNIEHTEPLYLALGTLK